MLGIAILVAAVGLALTSLRNLLVPLVGAVIAVVAIPEVAAWSMPLPVVGSVNAGVLVVLLTAIVQLTLRLAQYVADVVTAPAVWLCLAIWIVGGTITNFLAGTTAPGSWLELVLAPPLAYLLVQRLVVESPGSLRRLAQTIVAVAACEAVVALAVWAGVLPQPFADAHATFTYWWDPEFARALGTTDSPLALAGVVLVAIPLLLTIRNSVLVLALGALFMATIAAAESRGALLIGVVAFVVVIVRRRVSFLSTLTLATAAVATVIAAVTLAPELTTGLSDKLADDNGSANARLLGLTSGFPVALENPIVGGGYGAASDVARQLGLGTSFENPVVMTALDWGLVGAIALVVAQLVAVRRGLLSRGLAGSATAGLALVVYLQTYSSYALGSGTLLLLWIVLGLSLGPRPTRTDRAPQAIRPGRAHRASPLIGVR